MYKHSHLHGGLVVEDGEGVELGVEPFSLSGGVAVLGEGGRHQLLPALPLGPTQHHALRHLHVRLRGEGSEGE
jgi:hypothetical protein